MAEVDLPQEEFSFKNYFVPFTTLKAIHWIIFIGIVVYANMLFNAFVWDDKSYILFNSDVHTFNLLKIIGPNLFNSAGQYRPISVLYFTLLYGFSQNITFFYHLIQLFIHITNTSIVFILLAKFLNKKLSFFLSLIFLIHPMQVESVSYIAATDNPLYFLFGISALFLSIKEKVGYKRLLLIVILLIAAAFTNETGFLFLFAILLYRFLFTKREKLHFIIGAAAMTIIYSFIRFGIAKIYFTKLELIPIGQLNLFARLINLPAIIFYYLRTFFYPAKLVIDQQWIIEKINLQNFYLPLAIDLLFLFLIVGLGIYLSRTNKKLFKPFIFFALLFAVGIGLHSQIFPLDLTVADRWMYFPMFGILGMIGVVLQSIKLSQNKIYYSYYIAFIILLIFSARSIVRNTNWSNPITLYTHDTAIEDNWDLENNLGAEYRYIHEQQNALIHFKKAEAFFPFETTELSIGNIYWNMGNMQMVKKYYNKALFEKHFPSDGHKYTINTDENLGEFLLVTHQPQEAITFISLALQDYPTSPELWDELAISQSSVNDQRDAMISAKKALMLESNQSTNYIYEKIFNNKFIKVTPKVDGVNIVMKLFQQDFKVG